MIVKICGQKVLEVRTPSIQEQLVAECEAAGRIIESPVQDSQKQRAFVSLAVVASILLAASPALAVGAGAAVAGQSHPFEDALINSVKYDIIAIAVLFAFKRNWAKTAGLVSGLVYGAFFCSQTLAMGVAIIFTALNNHLTHWLEAVRLGVS